MACPAIAAKWASPCEWRCTGLPCPRYPANYIYSTEEAQPALSHDPAATPALRRPLRQPRWPSPLPLLQPQLQPRALSRPPPAPPLQRVSQAPPRALRLWPPARPLPQLEPAAPPPRQPLGPRLASPAPAAPRQHLWPALPRVPLRHPLLQQRPVLQQRAVLQQAPLQLQTPKGAPRPPHHLLLSVAPPPSPPPSQPWLLSCRQWCCRQWCCRRWCLPPSPLPSLHPSLRRGQVQQRQQLSLLLRLPQLCCLQWPQSLPRPLHPPQHQSRAPGVTASPAQVRRSAHAFAPPFCLCIASPSRNQHLLLA